MKLRDYVRELSNVKEELQDKDVMVIAENGLLFPAKMKFILKEKGSLDKTKENVECIVITHE